MYALHFVCVSGDLYHFCYTQSSAQNLLVVTTQEPDLTWMKSPRQVAIIILAPVQDMCPQFVVHSLIYL